MGDCTNTTHLYVLAALGENSTAHLVWTIPDMSKPVDSPPAPKPQIRQTLVEEGQYALTSKELQSSQRTIELHEPLLLQDCVHECRVAGIT